MMPTKIAYIGVNNSFAAKLAEKGDLLQLSTDSHPLEEIMNHHTELLIFESAGISEDVFYARFLKENFENVVLFVINNGLNPQAFMGCGADDVFSQDVLIEDMIERYRFIKGIDSYRINGKPEKLESCKIPGWKRFFDIFFALSMLTLLSPFFLLIALLIRLESKGKVFYTSPRVGMGYKMFGFYKFRSMYVDADKKIESLIKNNQYLSENLQAEQINMVAEKPGSGNMLINDEGLIPEEKVSAEKQSRHNTSFFKLANDPRITRVGRFLRNTSIDELPQLVNILKGDMSVVGNRPLPLYEAELLTKDKWIERFLAPAGLTGLWQVTKRGGANKMSAEERKELDISYARNYSFWYDMKIIVKTVPAMLQHENV